ncbi:hypothetical protein J7L00_04395, partial [Candidatus Bathyarchaeota archaeon]|nr:hypothetical protein [Candidatus Bathyarchaeota archaeon]
MNSQIEDSAAPYYRSHRDGKHGFIYNPPDKSTGRPAVTREERSTAIYPRNLHWLLSTCLST